MPTIDLRTVHKPDGDARRAPLLKLDPDLGRGLEPSELHVARDQLPVVAGTLPPGPWKPPTHAPDGAEFGLLITSGALTREVSVDSACTIELLGKGDLIRPWQDDMTSFAQSGWRVLEPATVVIISDAVVAAISRWPTAAAALMARGVQRSRGLAVQDAIGHIVGVEKRVLMTLWMTAERWGLMTQDGIVVDAPLTHALIAEMAGASRPYITKAIVKLTASGEISRRKDGRFILHGDAPV